MSLEGENYKLGVFTGYIRIGTSLLTVLLLIPLAISILTLEKYGNIAKVWNFSYYAVFFELGVAKYFIISLARHKPLSVKTAVYRIGMEFSLFASFFSYLIALAIYKVTDPFPTGTYAADPFLPHLSAFVTASTVHLIFRKSLLEGSGLLYMVNLVTAVHTMGNLGLVVILSQMTDDLRLLSSSLILFNLLSILVLSVLSRRIAPRRAAPVASPFGSLRNLRRSRIVIQSVLKRSFKLSLVGISGAAIQPIFRALSISAFPSGEQFAVIDLSLRAGAAVASLVNVVALPLLKIFGSMSIKSQSEMGSIANSASKISLAVFIGFCVIYFSLGVMGVIQLIYPFLASAQYFTVFSTIVFSLAFHAIFQPQFNALLAQSAFFEIYTVRAVQYCILFLGFGLFASQGGFIQFPIGLACAWASGGVMYMMALHYRIGRT